jgi:prepilin-type N-terminal cleavage/methylation domain-containing protein
MKAFMPARVSRQGFTLVEVLVAMTISTLIMAGMAKMVDAALAAQRASKEENDLRAKAQFALRRVSMTIMSAPYKQLAPKPASEIMNSANWLTPFRYDFANGTLTETEGTASRTIATGVTAFSVTSPATYAGRSVIALSITLQEKVTVSETVRLGGPA